MGRMILTGTKVLNTPYRMAESGHPLYSYEELCYYIKSRMALWLMEKTRPGLTKWLALCGISVENIDYCSPLEAAEKIFRSGRYFRKDEYQMVLSKMKEWTSFPEADREKETGDWYLFYDKIGKAWLFYDRAQKAAKEKDDPFLCSLYHNMGICCLKLFYWEEANHWLTKALNMGNKKETENALFLLLDTVRKNWEPDDTPVPAHIFAKKKAEFRNEL